MGIKAGMGRTWLPGNLLALEVISIVNNGLPQEAVGVFPLLEEKNEKSRGKPKDFSSAHH